MSEKDIIANFNYKKSNIMKTFKHKEKKVIAEIHGDIARTCGYEFPAWLVENDAWEEVTKDYEILEAQHKLEECRLGYDWAVLASKRNTEGKVQIGRGQWTEGDGEIYNITSVKRLSDEKVFSVDEVYDSRKIESFKEVDNTISVHYDDGTWHYLRSVQPEKDYEILAYKGFPSYEIHSTSFLAICSCKDIRFEIQTVKRLSDNEVFSVRDYVKDEGYSGFSGEIHKFEEDDKGLLVLYAKKRGGCGYLKHIQKSRQPILTTEDGVELFEGDKAYKIFINQPISKASEVTISEKSYINLSYMKYFSTREAAEEYRLYNYKGLSLKDVEDMASSNISEQSWIDLENLVKSRLLIS